MGHLKPCVCRREDKDFASFFFLKFIFKIIFYISTRCILFPYTMLLFFLFILLILTQIS